jgi:tRNA modification GTPase
MDRLKQLCESGVFISVQNKTDIFEVDSKNFDCCVSAKTGSGFNALKNLISESFDNNVKHDDYKYLIRERHEVLFKGVVKSLGVALSGLKQSEALELVAEELKNARSGLDEVVGKKFSDDLLGDIFRGYCIGK